MGQVSYTRMFNRGSQALARERLHRDYKQLLGDLHTLSREERLIKSTREQGLLVSFLLLYIPVYVNLNKILLLIFKCLRL